MTEIKQNTFFFFLISRLKLKVNKKKNMESLNYIYVLVISIPAKEVLYSLMIGSVNSSVMNFEAILLDIYIFKIAYLLE